ncbi:hypothetical protein ACWC5C_00875 [Streptomyces sp. NPDC001700]
MILVEGRGHVVPSPATGDTAWQHPATRRACQVRLALHLLGVPLGLAASVVVFFVILPTPLWLIWILAFTHLIAGICAVCLLQVPRARRMFELRRILRTYPWQVHEKGLPHSNGQLHSAHRGVPWLKVPDPDKPETWVSVDLDHSRHSRWWLERMSPQAGREAKTEIRTLWFAGDPRFRAILAVPGKRGPQRMLEVGRAVGRGTTINQTGLASDEALTRALKAGVPLSELARPAEASDRTPMVRAPAPPPGPALSFPATRRSMRLLLLRGTAVLIVAPVPFLGLLSLGPSGILAGKGLGMLLLATVVPAFQRLRTRFKLRRDVRGDGQPWRTLNVEIRHRGRAVVLVTGNEALRTQLVLRRPPAGRTQVWFAGHLHGDGLVSLRGDGAVVPVRCVEKGHARVRGRAGQKA